MDPSFGERMQILELPKIKTVAVNEGKIVCTDLYSIQNEEKRFDEVHVFFEGELEPELADFRSLVEFFKDFSLKEDNALALFVDILQLLHASTLFVTIAVALTTLNTTNRVDIHLVKQNKRITIFNDEECIKITETTEEETDELANVCEEKHGFVAIKEGLPLFQSAHASIDMLAFSMVFVREVANAVSTDCIQSETRDLINALMKMNEVLMLIGLDKTKQIIQDIEKQRSMMLSMIS